MTFVLAWRSAAQSARAPEPTLALSLALGVAAAALRSGQTVAEALRSAARVAGPPFADDLIRIAALLQLGADPARAWASGGPTAQIIGDAVVRSLNGGVRLADTLERLADDVRTHRAESAQRRAERAGVLTAAPLALCFLPAFVAIGVIPVIIGLLRTAALP